MSVRRESDCVDCGLPCFGRSCPHWERVYFECDSCGNEDAIYHIDDGDYCEDCAIKLMNEEWFAKTNEQKAKALQDDYEECLDSFFVNSDLETQAKYLDIGFSEVDYDGYSE